MALLKYIRLIRAISLMGLCLLAGSAFAQEEWEEGGEIESVEIEIVKEKQITLPKANRNFDKVPPRPVEKIQPEMTYDFKNFRFSTPDFQATVRPLRLKQEELQKINGGYVSAGIGNFASPFLAAAITSKRNANRSYGADFLHRSFGKGPVGDENSGSGNTHLRLFGASYNNKIAAGLNIGYENRATHFYGYQPTTREVRRDTIRQLFNIFSFGGRIENVKPGNFNFKLSSDFSYLDDYLRAAESEASIHFASDYKIKGDKKILLVSSYQLIARKDSLVEAKPRSLFKVAPHYQFNPIEKLKLIAGLLVAYEDDTVGKGSGVHVYPDVRATYNLSSSFDAFATLGGDVERVSLHTLSRENNWVNSNINIFHANKALDLKAGIRGKIGSHVTLQVGGGVSAYQHLYFFRNSVTEPSKFDVVYDNTTITQAFTEWGWVSANRASLSIRGDYFGYSMDKETEAWHRPTYRVTLHSNYNIFDKLSLAVNLVAQGGMRAFDSTASRVVDLDAAFDLNVKARYFVSKNFSCFIEGSNLLNADYPIFLNYPVRGLQVGGGVSWSF